MMKRNNLFKKAVFSLTLSLLCIFLISFSGCGKEEQAPVKKTPEKALSRVDKIKAAGKLVIGTSAEYPPYEFHLLQDKQGDLVGIDIDIADAIAQELGVSLEVKDIVFHRLFNALNSDEVDLVIAGLVPSENRKKIIDFSDVYYQAIQNIVIKAGDRGKITCVNDLRGKTVGTQKGSIQGDMVHKVLLSGDFVEMDTIDELISDLKKNKIDAVLLEKPVAESYVFRNKDLINIDCTESNFDLRLSSAIAVKKGNHELLKEVNRILGKLKAENKIAEFIENAKVLMKK
jgi:polar amino acid transport system substrate-binding protein